MKGFMKIAPYFNYNIGDKISYLKSSSGDLSNTKITANLLNNATFKKIVNDLTFYVKVTDIQIDLNVDVKSYKLLAPGSNEKAGYTHHHDANGGYTLKVSCITTDNDKTENKLNIEWLENHFLNNVPVSIVVNSSNIKNGVYDISKFNGFKLIRPDVYEFDIELTTHTSIKHKLTNKVTVLQSRLKRCKKPEHRVVTANQIKKGEITVKKGKKKTKVKLKSSSCLKYLNQVLKGKGCYTTSKGKYTAYKKYNGYFTKYTVAALKRYGKKWNKKGLKPKVNTKGKLSKNMWEAIKRYNEL